MILVALVLAAAPLADREAIGIFDGWGAFREGDRCFAVAQPAGARQSRAKAYADVASWRGRGIRNQVHIRLSRVKRDRSAVTLSIGERRFMLAGRDQDAWATDRHGDLAIVSAIRGARSMSVETVDSRGRAFADTYSLRGAATAIDAAALACVR